MMVINWAACLICATLVCFHVFINLAPCLRTSPMPSEKRALVLATLMASHFTVFLLLEMFYLR